MRRYSASFARQNLYELLREAEEGIRVIIVNRATGKEFEITCEEYIEDKKPLLQKLASSGFDSSAYKV